VERTHTLGKILHDISWAVWTEQTGNQGCSI
jgi:hypothetical protein